MDKKDETIKQLKMENETLKFWVWFFRKQKEKEAANGKYFRDKVLREMNKGLVRGEDGRYIKRNSSQE